MLYNPGFVIKPCSSYGNAPFKRKMAKIKKNEKVQLLQRLTVPSNPALKKMVIQEIT